MKLNISSIVRNFSFALLFNAPLLISYSSIFLHSSFVIYGVYKFSSIILSPDALSTVLIALLLK